MYQSSILISLISTVFFIIIRLVENHFLEKQHKYSNDIICRDAIIVFIVTLLGSHIHVYIIEYIQLFINYINPSKLIPINGGGIVAADIYTDTPNF